MNKNAKELLERYKQGTITAEEKLMVEDWFMKYGIEEEILLNEIDIDRVKAEMWEVIDEKRSKIKTVKLWPRMAAAAAIVLVAFSAGLFYISKQGQKNITAPAYASDVAPGKNTATLTLANGKVVQLNENKTGVVIDSSALTYNDGTRVAADDSAIPENNQMIANTPRGGTYQILLPDGSKVWLNAASTFKFPSAFSKSGNRAVELSGEAYFEISKDPAHPFVVKTDQQNIRVLGTHFNVTAYKDESKERTVLLEGSVNINNEKILSPGQQSEVGADGHISIESVDPESAVAWKNGYFMFKDVPLEIVMRQLSRWYDIEIVYNGQLTNETFNGLINRNANLSRILNILKRGGVHFDLQGRKLIVTP